MLADAPLSTRLNGICPYFTMFPLAFPYAILSQHAAPGDWVLDPFCGRGTTNYASRMVGLPSIGIDASPVAVALSRAKLVNATSAAITRAARCVLEEISMPTDIPEGEFWEWAFNKEVLRTLCRLREGLLHDCCSDARVALRAVLMGALHGPQPKSGPSYLSNQSPRTYAPKPRYAVRFWQSRGLKPPAVDVLALITNRAERYYAHETQTVVGRVIRGDSRKSATFACLPAEARPRWIITSPPYYGLRTYLPDQWLRWWFIGGPATVDYSTDGQISHASPAEFTAQLRRVWRNTAAVCAPDARMVVRFGGINDRKADPLAILTQSLDESGWAVEQRVSAGVASAGRRQALHFANCAATPLEEHDVWACLQGTEIKHDKQEES